MHGIGHWARVLENGLRLAEAAGANPEFVSLFAIFHDSQRLNDDHDPEHGLRGAEFAALLRGVEYELKEKDFQSLIHCLCSPYPRKESSRCDGQNMLGCGPLGPGPRRNQAQGQIPVLYVGQSSGFHQLGLRTQHRSPHAAFCSY